MNTLSELKNIIKGEVLAENLDAYSHDASIFEIKPSFVVQPKDSEDVKNLVGWVANQKSASPELSLTARSGGTDMTGGPINDSIIVDFGAHFNHIGDIGDSHATTEPGVFYRDFEKETLKKELLLPSYPASREICMVGGMVANNSGGEKSLRFGKTEDYVEELNVVLSDGKEYIFRALDREELEQKKIQSNFEGDIYRQVDDLLQSNKDIIEKAKPNVSKNSAGYFLWNIIKNGKFDLTKLFVGSQGTLGLITKIKFRLIKPSKYSQLLVIFLKDLNSLGELVLAINKSNPESFESFDDQTFKLVFKILPDLIKRMGIFAMLKFIPDLWVVLAGGVPKLVMIVEFTGDDQEGVKRKAQSAKQEIDSKFKVRSRVTKDYQDAQKYWLIRRESFNLLRKHVKGKKTAPFIDDVIVRPEYLPEFLPRLNNIIDEYKNYLTYTIAGHPGDGNFHIIPLMNLADAKSRKIIPEISNRVYDLVLEFHGSITAEHNDGLIRTPYLGKMYGPEICALFEKIKQIFDPQNIFNPGKKVPGVGSQPLLGNSVGGDIGYAMSHIRRD